MSAERTAVSSTVRGGDDTLYIYGSGFADGGPGHDTYILMPPMEETALVASSSLPGILAGGPGRGKLPHINVESADAVYLTGLLPGSTEFQTLSYKDQRFNQIRGRLSTLPEGTYLVLTRFNRNYLATIVDVANGAFTARDAAIVNIPAGNESGIEKIFKKGRGPGKRGASSGGTVDPSSPAA